MGNFKNDTNMIKHTKLNIWLHDSSFIIIERNYKLNSRFFRLAGNFVKNLVPKMVF